MITREDADWVPQLRVEVRGRLGTVVDAWDGSGTGALYDVPTYVRVQYDDTTISDEVNDGTVVVLSRPLFTEVGWVRRTFPQ